MFTYLTKPILILPILLVVFVVTGCSKNNDVFPYDDTWNMYKNPKMGISVKIPRNASVEHHKDYEMNILSAHFSDGPITSIQTWLLYYGNTDIPYHERVKKYREKIQREKDQNTFYAETEIEGKTVFIAFTKKDDDFYIESVHVPIDEKRFGYVRFGCEDANCALRKIYPQVTQGTIDEKIAAYTVVICDLIISIN